MKDVHSITVAIKLNTVIAPFLSHNFTSIIQSEDSIIDDSMKDIHQLLIINYEKKKKMNLQNSKIILIIVKFVQFTVYATDKIQFMIQFIQLFSDMITN